MAHSVCQSGSSRASDRLRTASRIESAILRRGWNEPTAS